MPVGRSRQGTNQAGALAPLHSVWGGLLGSSTPRLIERPLPIGTKPHNFGGTVGAVVTIAASVRTLSTEPGYFGDVPEAMQDTVEASPPWSRV